MSCKGPNAGIMSATQENLVAVGEEMLALYMEIAEIRMLDNLERLDILADLERLASSILPMIPFQLVWVSSV